MTKKIKHIWSDNLEFFQLVGEAKVVWEANNDSCAIFAANSTKSYKLLNDFILFGSIASHCNRFNVEYVNITLDGCGSCHQIRLEQPWEVQ